MSHDGVAERPLKVVNSKASPCSKATHSFGVSRLTMLGQPLIELLVRMAGDHLQWKDTTLTEVHVLEGYVRRDITP